MRNKMLIFLSLFLYVFCMSVDTHAQTLLEYQKQKQEEIAKQKRIAQEKEHKIFQEACASGIDALNRFVMDYPKSVYVNEAMKRIKDYSFWEKAQKQNTKQAYHTYLTETRLHSYDDEAQKAIRVIEAEEAWLDCKESKDWLVIEKFINTHLDFPQIEEAKYRYNLLKGEQAFELKNYASAYSYLKLADAYQSLKGLPAEHLKHLKDQQKFEEICNSTDISTVNTFLRSLDSDSPFYIPTSNHLALLKSDLLNGYSSDYSMEEALSYAKDYKTREVVQGKIKVARAYRAYYKRQKRSDWWKHRFMVGWNVLHVDYLSNNALSAGTGLRFRLGRWDDRVNFIFGVEYSYIWDIESGGVDRMIGQRIALPASLRLNLCNLSSGTELYIGCGGDFGFKLKDGDTSYFLPMNKYSIGVEPQIGLAGLHWDLGFYYTRYLDGYTISPTLNNQRVGLLFTWYF